MPSSSSKSNGKSTREQELRAQREASVSTIDDADATATNGSAVALLEADPDREAFDAGVALADIATTPDAEQVLVEDVAAPTGEVTLETTPDGVLVVTPADATETPAAETPDGPVVEQTPADQATWGTPTVGTASPFAPVSVQHALKVKIGNFFKAVCCDEDYPVVFQPSKEVNEGATRCLRCVAKLNGTEIPEVALVLKPTKAVDSGPTLPEIATLFRTVQGLLERLGKGETLAEGEMPAISAIEAAIARLERPVAVRTTTTTTAGGTTTTSSKVAAVPGGRVQVTDKAGVSHNLSYALAARKLAGEFGAELAAFSAQYIIDNDVHKKSINARLPIEKDLKAGLLPEGTIVFVTATGEVIAPAAPAAAAVSDAVVDTAVDASIAAPADTTTTAQTEGEAPAPATEQEAIADDTSAQ